MEEINIDLTINKILKDIWIPSSWGFREIPIFEITPIQFLNFSKSDINLKSMKNTINALTNVKRFN